MSNHIKNMSIHVRCMLIHVLIAKFLTSDPGIFTGSQIFKRWIEPAFLIGYFPSLLAPSLMDL